MKKRPLTCAFVNKLDKDVTLPARRGPKAARRPSVRAAYCLSSDDYGCCNCLHNNNKYNAIKSRYESKTICLQPSYLARVSMF